MKSAVLSWATERGSALWCRGLSPSQRILKGVPAEAFPARARHRDARRFTLIHFWIPLALLIAATVVLMVLHGDLWIADRIYAWEGHRWALRQSLVAKEVLHQWGHDLSVAAWLAVFAAWLVTFVRDGLALWRRPLAYLLVTVALSTLAVAWIKAWSNMDCPWDVVQYGGSKPYVDVFSLRPLGLARGRCFPAGHASAGYAWMSLYFFFLLTRPRWRQLGLVVGGGLGLLFGIDQQLRGAHFSSHDIWAAGICWMVALGFYRVFRRGSSAQADQLARRNAGEPRDLS